jgi:HTH-type transcriptional regulator / antitoxin HigA
VEKLMALRSTKRPRGKDRYFELVKQFPLRPIRNERDLSRAISVIDSLVSRDLSTDEDDYLDVLSDLVEKYETETIPEPPMSDGLLLAAHLDARGMTQAELARGARVAESTISSVIHGSRKLTRAQIVRISAFLKIDPAQFLFD